jgi:hypothetical protein
MSPSSATPRRTAMKLAGVIVLAGVIGGVPLAAHAVQSAGKSIANVVSAGLRLMPIGASGDCGAGGSACLIGAKVYPGAARLSTWCVVDADGVKSCRV